jgi:regulator of sigma E protease
MARSIHQRPDAAVRLEIARPGAEGQTPKAVHVTIRPKKDPQSGIGLIGVMPRVTQVKLGFRDSVKVGFRDIKAWTLQPLGYLRHKITQWEGPKELSGPIGIAQMVTKATKEGMSYVIYLMAVISTGLGLFNLFPIPILDGGHILLYTIEGILRRPLSRRTLQIANAVGLSLILTIFLYASYQDVLRWRLGLWK